MKFRVGVALAAAVTVAAAGCSSHSEDPGTSLAVTYDGTVCAHSGAETLAVGSVAVTYVNDSDEDVGLSTRVLIDEYTWADFAATTSFAEMAEVSTSVSWLDRALEGQKNRGELTETVELAEGTVALLCVTFAPDDGPSTDFHIVQRLEVVG